MQQQFLVGLCRICIFVFMRRCLSRNQAVFFYGMVTVISLYAFYGMARADTVGGQVTDRAAATGGAANAYRAVTGDTSNFLVVPVPIANPTIGNGLSLVGLYTFATSDDPSSPRSTIAAGGGYTDTESWAAAAGFDLHLDDDRFRVNMLAGLGVFNLEYYGIGGDSFFADNPIGYFADGAFVEAGAEIRLIDSLYAGISFRYLDSEIGVDLPIDVLPEISVPFELFAIGPTLEYDDRDSSWWPTSGTHASANFLKYWDAAEILGFELRSGFRTFDLSAAHYVSLTEDLVFAGQAGLSTASDSTPFFLQPSVSVRGFPSGRYLDSAVVQMQGEFRWNIWKKLGAVAFGGIGATGAALVDLENTAYGYGAGLRYRISQVDRMNIGVDIASGDGELAFYFRVGEAF